MNTVDDYIRQWSEAPRGGAVSTFTVDRENAVAMMRKFALAHREYYVLEFIQSAIANGAESLEIELYRYGTQVDFRIHWSGEHFSRLGLLNLFDYLFESQENREDADIILFARAINALLHFEPQELIVVSEAFGGGEPIRMAIDPERGTTSLINDEESTRMFSSIKIPTLESLVARGGVTVRACDLRGMPPELRFPRRGGNQWPELQALRQRVDLESLSVKFNRKKVLPTTLSEERFRTPSGALLPVVEVEEENLRAQLWRSHHEEPVFYLMTYGVIVERLIGDSLPFGEISGVVNFDRFTKTADQYGVVRDSNFDHCMARLRPYTDLVQDRREHTKRGRSDDVGTSVQIDTSEARHDIRLVGGEPLRPEELTELLRATDRVLFFPKEKLEEKSLLELSEYLASDIDATRLVMPQEEVATLRALAGPEVEVLALNWDDERDLQFCRAPSAQPPARPWLIEDVEFAPLEIAEFLRMLADEHDVEESVLASLREGFGVHGEVRGTIYTPSLDSREAGALHHRWVRIVSSDRVVWEGTTTSPTPGHLLTITLPAISPSLLLQPVVFGQEERPIARVIAEQTAELATDELARATSLAMRRLTHMEITPGSTGSRMLLRDLTQNVVLRLESTPGESPHFHFVQLSNQPEYLQLPLFTTLWGSSISAEKLAGLLSSNGGLIYGTRRSSIVANDREPEVLILDEELETLLIEMIGADAYQRVSDQEKMEVDDDRQVAELVEIIRSEDSSASQEMRRQARRRLLQHIIAGIESETIDEENPLLDLGLIDGVTSAISMRDILDARRQDRPVIMLDGRSRTVIEPVGESTNEVDDGPLELVMNPFVATHLSALIGVEPAFLFPLNDRDEGGQERSNFLIETTLEVGRFKGVVGLSDEPARDTLAIFDRSTGQMTRLAIDGQTQLAGLLETTALPDQSSRDAINQAIRRTEAELIARLLHGLPDLDIETREGATTALLHFAGRHLHIWRDEREQVHYDITDDMARSILTAPLFSSGKGFPLTGYSLIRDFCLQESGDSQLSRSQPEDLPAVVDAWRSTYLKPSRIYQTSVNRPVPGGLTDTEALGEFRKITAWLEHLWPEDSAEQRQFESIIRPMQDRSLPMVPLFGLPDSDGALIGILMDAKRIHIYLYPDHPLVEKAQRADGLDDATIAVLYTIYMGIGRLRDMPQGQEVRFQENIVAALLE